MASNRDPESEAIDSLLRGATAFREAFLRKRPRKIHNAQINWGHGRLAAFSSQTSFIAQFCALNDLKLSTLERFLADYFGCGEGWWRIFSDEFLPLLAKLIDEPIATVKLLGNDSFTLPACFGSFECNFYEIKHDKYVSFCPVCLENGFHGVFHEAPWLYLCPLHRVPIKRVPVVGGAAQYIAVVTELLRSACSRWPDIWGGKALKDNDPPDFIILRAWLKIVRDKTMRLRNQSVASLGEGVYSFDDIDILLGRLNVIAPIPTELIDLFIAPPRRQKEERIEVARDAVSTIKVLGKNCSLWYLLWFFNKYEAILPSWRFASQLLATQAINRNTVSVNAIGHGTDMLGGGLFLWIRSAQVGCCVHTNMQSKN